jgi:hypothetical protein
MNFVERELGKITQAMAMPQEADRYCQLYAAQQALAWASDPSAFAAPSAVIVGGLVQPLTGTPADSADCLGEARHSAS